MGEEYFGEPWAVRKTTGFDLTNRHGRWIGCFSDADGVLGSDMAERARDCVNALAGISDPAAFIADTHELLDRIETYFDQRSDVVDGDYGVPEPNAEMQHLTAVQSVLAKLGRG
ncbi:MAG TPA: hypothetical protein DCY10_05280 [Clostridiales bacterium]|nr:hypothetical protein [Clostridiales bacterium]